MEDHTRFLQQILPEVGFNGRIHVYESGYLEGQSLAIELTSLIQKAVPTSSGWHTTKVISKALCYDCWFLAYMQKEVRSRSVLQESGAP